MTFFHFERQVSLLNYLVLFDGSIQNIIFAQLSDVSIRMTFFGLGIFASFEYRIKLRSLRLPGKFSVDKFGSSCSATQLP